MARTGGLGGNGSGDIFLAFSTANMGAARGDEKGLAALQSITNDHIDPLLFSTAYAAEEAIINSMVAAEDMVGHKGVSIKALPHAELQNIMRKYNRI
jgi:D-aminopeptidase